jgi:hypothetical protein
MFKIKKHKPGRLKRRPEKIRQGIEDYVQLPDLPKLPKEDPVSQIQSLEESQTKEVTLTIRIPVDCELAAWAATVMFEQEATGRRGVMVCHPKGLNLYQVQDIVDAGDHFLKQSVRFANPPKEEAPKIILPGNIPIPPMPGRA